MCIFYKLSLRPLALNFLSGTTEKIHVPLTNNLGLKDISMKNHWYKYEKSGWKLDP